MADGEDEANGSSKNEEWRRRKSRGADGPSDDIHAVRGWTDRTLNSRPPAKPSVSARQALCRKKKKKRNASHLTALQHTAAPYLATCRLYEYNFSLPSFSNQFSEEGNVDWSRGPADPTRTRTTFRTIHRLAVGPTVISSSYRTARMRTQRCIEQRQQI